MHQGDGKIVYSILLSFEICSMTCNFLEIRFVIFNGIQIKYLKNHWINSSSMFCILPCAQSHCTYKNAQYVHELEMLHGEILSTWLSVDKSLLLRALCIFTAYNVAVRLVAHLRFHQKPKTQSRPDQSAEEGDKQYTHQNEGAIQDSCQSPAPVEQTAVQKRLERVDF